MDLCRLAGVPAQLCPTASHAVRPRHSCVQSHSRKVKLKAYDAFVQHIGDGTPAGTPDDHRTTVQLLNHALDSLSPSGANGGEVRRAAILVIRTIYSYRPADVVHAVHERLGPGSGQTDLMRARSHYPGLFFVRVSGPALRGVPTSTWSKLEDSMDQL